MFPIDVIPPGMPALNRANLNNPNNKLYKAIKDGTITVDPQRLAGLASKELIDFSRENYAKAKMRESDGRGNKGKKQVRVLRGGETMGIATNTHTTQYNTTRHLLPVHRNHNLPC